MEMAEKKTISVIENDVIPHVDSIPLPKILK
jgi:hypothetical protein